MKVLINVVKVLCYLAFIVSFISSIVYSLSKDFSAATYHLLFAMWNYYVAKYYEPTKHQTI